MQDELAPKLSYPVASSQTHKKTTYLQRLTG